METTKEILSEDELTQYRSAHENFKRGEAELAYATSQLSLIGSRQKSSLMNYDNAVHTLDDIQSKLTEKYDGDFKINLENGEIIR